MGSAHATLAPSAGDRWTLCPGSVALIESLPEEQQDKPNIDSVRGTACHEVLAACLEEGVKPREHVGADVDVKGWHQPYRITDEDAANVEVAIEYVNRRMMEMGVGATRLLVEHRVDPGAVFDPPTDACDGTADVILLGRREVEIIDYKNGTRRVEPDCTQLTLYMIGALAVHPHPGQVEALRQTIVQPRLIEPGVDRVRFIDRPVGELRSHREYLSAAARYALSPDAPRVPGEKQCKWCPAVAVCPELAQHNVSALAGAESPSPASPNGSGAAQTAAADDETPKLDEGLLEALTRTPDQLTPEQAARVLEAEPLIRSWLSAVSGHALTRMMRGDKVPGFKLVQGRRSREWDDEDEMRVRLSRTSRIGDDGKPKSKLKKQDYIEEKLVSVAQAEKRIRPMVTERSWKSISEHIEQKEGKPTIAPETDSRPAIEVKSGAEVFGIGESAQSPATPAEEANTEKAEAEAEKTEAGETGVDDTLPDFLR